MLETRVVAKDFCIGYDWVMLKLVLIRHGESVWNKENRFTGWTDVDLSEKGVDEASQAGEKLKAAGFIFDIAFTSVLKRANKTLDIVLGKMGLDIPILKSWKLNERHYGALQGLNKAETMAKFGEGQVKIWRRSYDVKPPLLEKTDPRYPGHDPLYADLSEDELPVGECLKDTVDRFLPYFETEILPAILMGKHVLIVAHGNSLRALVKHLDKMSNEEVLELNIPTGVPLVYELTEEGEKVKSYYLDDLSQDVLEARAQVEKSETYSECEVYKKLDIK